MTERERLVLVSCGAVKLGIPAPAGLLYRGPYHRACLEYARLIVPERQIMVLSAKYGLVPLDQVIHPYELRFGMPGAIGAGTLRRQAEQRCLLDREVIVFGGRDYCRLAAQVWPDCQMPLAGRGGIGSQMQWLRYLRQQFIAQGELSQEAA